ncbi:DUF1223 domain-containing protein [Thauera sp. CAU 1555]|uniref:DUF1223 domain-containing protein n=1 Tax=Thauera sedimentorum TaxID=2767595 RepID=A0ABR9BC03_9RHOO|nr:DUF1223 domain-containing protein [Thauera sedimentorum]MBC9072053.1 DUF1223 domain-containing protein [Thauera sedimentorum]MBD8502972.1 DUF1223 domain-containing protein [Thauera sedimentorum]
MPRKALASLTLIAAATLTAPQALAAAGCSAESPAHTVALVELYTSEGCSSCPPADRWLSTLPGGLGADRLVPLALHVDYWDYIGWQDPYAQAQFTARQRRLGQLSGSRTIYTPEVFVGMRELRGWHNGSTFARQIQAVNAQPARAAIALAMRPLDGREVELEARFALPAGQQGGALQGVLVLYEDKLVSDVRRGENAGVTLGHDRVVRRWLPRVLEAGAAAQVLRETVALPAGWNPANLGAAAFVEDMSGGEVLQALALPGCLAAGG